MTITDLMGIFEDMAETYGDDTEVRMQCQEAWPFEHTIAGVTDSAEMALADHYEETGDDDTRALDGEDIEPIVYLVQGSQLGYGNKAAWANARRS